MGVYWSIPIFILSIVGLGVSYVIFSIVYFYKFSVFSLFHLLFVFCVYTTIFIQIYIINNIIYFYVI